MLTLLCILSLILVQKLNVQFIPKYCFFISLLIFSLAIDGNEYGVWESFYVFDRAYNDVFVYFYWFAYYVSFIVFCSILHVKKIASFNENILLFGNINIYRLSIIARCFAFFSISAALYNTYNAGDISQMFLSPRAWEKSFGRSVIFNYVYFQHLVAIVLLSVLIKVKGVNTLDLFLLCLCLFVSFLHGIKFTVIHAFIYLIFSGYIINGFKFNRYIYVVFFVLLLFLLIFFTFVRGGGAEGILGYIISASVNSIYTINKVNVVDVGNFKTLLPILDPGLFEKIYIRLTGSYKAKGFISDSGYLLNNKYNLTSAVTIVSLLGPFSILFWSIFLAFLIKFLSRVKDVFQLVLLIHIFNTLLLMFTAWEFYKIKLLSVLFFSYLANLYIIKGKNENISNYNTK